MNLGNESSSSSSFPSTSGSEAFPLEAQLYNLQPWQWQCVVITIISCVICISCSLMVFYYFFVQTTYRAILQAENFNWYLIFAVVAVCLESLMKLSSSSAILLQTIQIEDCKRLGILANVFDCLVTTFTIAFYASLLFVRLRFFRRAYDSVIPRRLHPFVGILFWSMFGAAIATIESTGDEPTLAVLGHCYRTPRPHVRTTLAGLLVVIPVCSLVLLVSPACFEGLVLRGRITWHRHWPMLIRFFVTALISLVGDVTSLTVQHPQLTLLPLLSAYGSLLTISVPFVFLVTENLFAAAWASSGPCGSGGNCCCCCGEDGSSPGERQYIEVQTNYSSATPYSRNWDLEEAAAAGGGDDASPSRRGTEGMSLTKDAPASRRYEDSAAAATVLDSMSSNATLAKRGFTMLFRTSLGLEYQGRPISDMMEVL